MKKEEIIDTLIREDNYLQSLGNDWSISNARQFLRWAITSNKTGDDFAKEAADAMSFRGNTEGGDNKKRAVYLHWFRTGNADKFDNLLTTGGWRLHNEPNYNGPFDILRLSTYRPE